jgi:hypothetical protein
MTQQQGDDSEIIVHHRAPHRTHVRSGPSPELGVHFHGPRILAANDAASVALFAVYGYSWGLEVEIKAARRSWEVRETPYDPIGDDGLQLGFAMSTQDMVLHTLPPGPHGESVAVSWHVASGSGRSVLPGVEASAHFKIAVLPYPRGEVLLVGWAWPELGLPEGMAEIILPEPGAFSSAPLLTS